MSEQYHVCHAGKPTRITGVSGWKGSAESLLLGNSQPWPVDRVSTAVINRVLGECHLPWSVLCPLLSSSHTYFLLSDSSLCLHFLPCSQIISLISSSAAVVCLSLWWGFSSYCSAFCCQHGTTHQVQEKKTSSFSNWICKTQPSRWI